VVSDVLGESAFYKYGGVIVIVVVGVMVRRVYARLMGGMQVVIIICCIVIAIFIYGIVMVIVTFICLRCYYCGCPPLLIFDIDYPV
jgi:hypothetical protein